MRKTLLRRIAALLTGVGLAVAGLALAVAPAQAASFSVSIAASDGSVRACEGVNLTGTVSPRPSGHTVYVQEQRVGQTAWTTVAKVSTTSGGDYRTTVVPATAGDRYYRIYKPGQGHRKAGHSRQILVAVAPQTGDARVCTASSSLSAGGTTTITGTGAGAATGVTFTPQADAGDLAAGFTALPAIPATFVAVAADTVKVTVPPGLGGSTLVTVATPTGDLTATFVYKRTWRSPTSFENAVLAQLNKRRAHRRTCDGKSMPAVAPLTWDGGLSDLALSHSRDLAARQDVYQGLSHVTYGTSDVSVRFRRAGVTGGFGEILALSPESYSASQVVGQWIASTTGHCESVMNKGWTKAGVGVAPGVWQTTYGPQRSIFSNVDFQ